MENPEPAFTTPAIEAPPVYGAPESGVPPVDSTLPLGRTPIGWALLIFVFAVIGLGTYASSKISPLRKHEDPYTQEELIIRSEMYQRSFWMRAGEWNDSSRVQAQKQLGDDLFKPLWKTALQDPRAARLIIVAQREKGVAIDPRLFAKILEKPVPKNRAFVQLYQANKLTMQQVDALSAKMPDDEWAFKAAKIHGHDLAGDSAARLKFAPAWKFIALMIIGVGALGFVVLGIIAWTFYFSQRSMGKLAPLGHPAEPLTPAEADRFALRAGLLMTLFLAIQIVVGVLLMNATEWVQMSGMFTVMLVGAIALHKLRVLGLPIPLSRVGVQTQDLKAHILWGIGGYVASIPGLAVALIFGQLLMKIFGPSSHPASEIIASSPSLPMILAILFSAAMVAPFWEEIMFRGTLLPALSRLFGKPVWGILISSFMFAAIHPQGVPLWLGLGFIGAMNCMLAYQTRSLIPCMVLHALNNGIILIIGLIIS